MNSIIAEPKADTINFVTPEEKQEYERNLIRSLAGNYKVSFKFAETFSPIKDYEYRDRHFSQAKELAFILEDSEEKISIQHILYVGNKVIKHWRQDWLYENREILSLVKDHEWKKTYISPEEAKGTWTQKVYQVDDCPRYEGYGTWVHVDGRHFWESTADAALPRREITQRDDYNVLRRNSHIEIFDDGSWLLEQDNEKIYRDENNEDTLICLEKGLERFTPKEYDTSKTMEWWNERKAFWADVRDIWSEIIEKEDLINIQDDQGQYFGQFELAEKFSGENYVQDEAQTAIKAMLSEHLIGYKG